MMLHVDACLSLKQPQEPPAAEIADVSETPVARAIRMAAEAAKKAVRPKGDNRRGENHRKPPCSMGKP